MDFHLDVHTTRLPSVFWFVQVAALYRTGMPVLIIPTTTIVNACCEAASRKFHPLTLRG